MYKTEEERKEKALLSKKRDYEKHKARYIERAKLWKLKNKDKVKLSGQRRYIKKIEEFKLRRKSDPLKYQKRLEWEKEYRLLNKEKIRLGLKKWREENKGYKKEIDRKWRELNLERVKQKQKIYLKMNPFIGIKAHLKRRALLQKTICCITKKELNLICERDKVCVYCGSQSKLTFDHIIPVSKGGHTIFNNFVLSCKSCNCSKMAKDVFSWCNEKGFNIPDIVITLLKRQMGLENKDG